MHDVLVRYLEVNFPEMAEQLAHPRPREPGIEERAAAAERLRELIRRLRRGAVESGTAWHEPRASAAEMIAGVNGELSPDERAVLDHFFELFARSMERTQAPKPPEAVAVTPPAPEPPLEPVVAEAPTPEAPPEPEPDPVLEPTAEHAPGRCRRGPCRRRTGPSRGRLGRCGFPRRRGHCPVPAPRAADRGAGPITAYPMAAGPAGCRAPRGPGGGSGDGAPGPQPGKQSR